MKKLLALIAMVALAAAPVFAQTTTATSTNNVQAVVSSNPAQTLNTTSAQTVNNAPSQTITQNYAAADPGQGRWFVPPVQPYSAPAMPYLGPWSSGTNIIEDLRILPEVITLDQANKMYVGGVRARINKMADGSHQFTTCKLMSALPMKPLLDSEGNAVKTADGKPIMVPDEAKFQRMAFIFLQGNKRANTVDVIAKAALEAMKAGANGIYLIKKVTATSTSSFGWGIGIGSVTGSLEGADKQKSEASSAGTGVNFANAKPVYREGMVVLAIRE